MNGRELAAARAARPFSEERLLYKAHGRWRAGELDRFPDLLEAGDVLVVNDSATLPASLRLRDGQELRLMGRVRGQPGSWHALLLGPGDWRTPTERRAFANGPALGDWLEFAQAPGGSFLRAQVVGISPEAETWLQIRFTEAIGESFYAIARPLQYSYLNGDAPLYQMQTPFAARPWSVEMPSAGRPLRWGLIAKLQARGVCVVSLTHGCGISSGGDPRIDRRLPLEEEYEIPGETARAIAHARGRVIAVGTSAVRALESAARGENSGELRAGRAWTELRLTPEFRPRIVDGILTGLHEPGESHFELLGAFLPPGELIRALDIAREHALLKHELGDSMLVFRDASPQK